MPDCRQVSLSTGGLKHRQGGVTVQQSFPALYLTIMLCSQLTLTTFREQNAQSTDPLICRVVLFVGMFPVSGADFEALNAAVERLTLNDASVAVKRENSTALGAGFRCGCVIFHSTAACCSTLDLGLRDDVMLCAAVI